MNYIKEACVETKEEIISAANSGADRFELCEFLEFGGYTPSRQLINFTIKNTTVPTVVMIRRKNNNFFTNPFDFLRLKIDIIERRKMNISGFVFGILNKNCTVNTRAMRSLIRTCKGKDVVFHMAFDEIVDKEAALLQLIELGVKRILTKGGRGEAMENIGVLKRLNEVANGKIEIIAGGKITRKNYQEIALKTNLKQFHGRKLVC